MKINRPHPPTLPASGTYYSDDLDDPSHGEDLMDPFSVTEDNLFSPPHRSPSRDPFDFSDKFLFRLQITSILTRVNIGAAILSAISIAIDYHFGLPSLSSILFLMMSLQIHQILRGCQEDASYEEQDRIEDELQI